MCLRDGLFTWTINSLNFLLYVISLRCRYFEMTSFSKEDVWSLSSPSLWSKKGAELVENTFVPICLKTILWIFKSVFFSFSTLVPAPTTCLWKTYSVILTTLNTAADRNTNPPLCLKAVNLAHKGPTDSCEAWPSVGSSSSSPLNVSQETFARSDWTMYPAMYVVFQWVWIVDVIEQEHVFSQDGILVRSFNDWISHLPFAWETDQSTYLCQWVFKRGAVPCFWWLSAVSSQDSLQCILELQSICVVVPLTPVPDLIEQKLNWILRQFVYQ